MQLPGRPLPAPVRGKEAGDFFPAVDSETGSHDDPAVRAFASRHGSSARQNLEGIHEVLRTIALAGSEPVLGQLLPLTRELLEAEQALAYRLDLREDGPELDFVHVLGAGPPERIVPAAIAFVRRAGPGVLGYHFPRPLPGERNVLFNSATGPYREHYRASPLVREFFPSLGFRDPELLRVLVCDGPHILSWFGVFRSRPFEARQAERLALLVEPLRRRLQLEDRLRRLAVRSAALDVAMEAMCVPAVIVDRQGRVVHANEAARALSAEDRDALLERARSQKAANDFELLPIRAAGLPPHAFVVQRKGPSLRQRAALFGRRHGLTPRQVEVLVALVDGRTNKEIAAALGIQEKTVELHVTAILRKTGAEKRSELITAFWNGR